MRRPPGPRERRAVLAAPRRPGRGAGPAGGPPRAGLDAASVGPLLARHLRAAGVADEDLEPRLEACVLRTALAAMGYCALAGRARDATDRARVRRRIQPLLG